MTIKFLKAHEVAGSIPKVTYSAGQEVSDLAPESEGHFVSRGSAAYLVDGKLYDAEGREMSETSIVTEVVNVADNRDDGGRDGKLDDGTPHRASSGPGDVVVTTPFAKPPVPDPKTVTTKPGPAKPRTRAKK